MGAHQGMGGSEFQFDLFDSRAALEELRADVAEAELDPPIVHSIVRADEAQALQVTGPTSVFDLAMTGLRMRTALSAPEKSRNVKVVTRAEGVVRCQVVRFAETEEGQEKERQRRARQIVPRARKQTFRMKNSRIWDDRQS
ncbi:hypothetical protein [Comamonas terrae]|nr:hypothetical protein [Comamonas terrae]